MPFRYIPGRVEEFPRRGQPFVPVDTKLGRLRYPAAPELLMTADGGGRNETRVRLWKIAWPSLADETGRQIAACHFPPGTSQWKKIEPGLFSHTRRNGRGKPLTSHGVIVS